MFFLLRCAFWLTVVLALLPSGGAQPSTPASQVSAVDALMAAGTAVSDMRHFCDRQAEACEVGAQTAVAIGHRAQAGAKMVIEFFNDRMTRSETASVTESRNAKVVPAALSAQHGSQHTLKSEDLAPDWQGPIMQREAVPLPRRDMRRAT